MNPITKNQRGELFSLLNQLGWTAERAVIVPQFTSDRTDSVAEMSRAEAVEMIVFLKHELGKLNAIAEVFKNGFVAQKATGDSQQAAATVKKDPSVKVVNNDASAIKMRKKVLGLLGTLGYLTATGGFDYPRIHAFIEHIGSRNPDKKGFNYLTNAELSGIITQIEQIQKKGYAKG